MVNTNCLEGWICPMCGQSEEFRVQALHTVALIDDGATPVDGEEEYGVNSPCLCPECDETGVVSDFCQEGNP